jgi:hypothetical protein
MNALQLYPNHLIIAKENSFSSANKGQSPFFQPIVLAEIGISMRIKIKSKIDVSYKTIIMAV